MIPDSLSKLADQGPAWALLLLAIGVITYLYKQLTKEREQCSSDFKTIISGNMMQLKAQEGANEARLRVAEANARALELMTVALNQLSGEISKLSDIIHQRTEEAISSNRAVREALLKKGVDL